MSNEAVSANPLGTERTGKLMVRFAVPGIISFVVNSLYNMVDQIFIGQGVGYLDNAATNIILPFTTILIAPALMIGDGVAAYISLYLGKGKREDASRGAGNAIIVVILIGVVMMVLFECFMVPLCKMFG